MSGCGCSGCGDVTVYPPYKNLCNGELVDVTGKTLCDFSLPVCDGGTEGLISGADLFALIAQSMSVSLGDQKVNFSISATCEAEAALDHQDLPTVTIIDDEGNEYESTGAIWTIPKPPAIVNQGDVQYQMNANGDWVIPDTHPTILDDAGNLISFNETTNEWTLPPHPTIIDDAGNPVPFDADDNEWTLPPHPTILDDEGNLIEFNATTNEWTLPPHPEVCIVDDAGVSLEVDADGCFVIPTICIADSDGTVWEKDTNGCFTPPTVQCAIGYQPSNITIDEGVQNINLTDYITVSDGSTLAFLVIEDSADGVYIDSTSGNNVSFSTDHSACEFTFDVQVACLQDGVEVGNPSIVTINGQLQSGIEVLGESLIDADEFDSAVEGPVSAGNEFAPGWSNPTLDYKFNSYPFDTSIAIMEGDYDGVNDPLNDPAVNGVRFAAQVAFPGDPSYGVPARQRWLYANGNTTGGPYIIAERVITGIVPGTEYELVAYVSNAIRPESTFGDAPQTQFRIDGVAIGTAIPVPYDSAAFGGVDTWTRHTRRWTAPAGVTTATFSIYDAATGANGDDFALTNLGFQEVTTC